MKRCPKCGAVSRRPGEKFCAHCGAPLSETPPQAPSWPPEAFVRRKRIMVAVTVAVVVILIAVLWVVAFGLFGNSAQPADAPVSPLPVTAESAAPTATPAVSASPEDADRLYLENLTEAPGLRITVNGVETTFHTAPDGRLYLDRDALTQTDTLLRAIQPQGDGYQTSLALVSKPSNPTASFGAMTPCDAEGYSDPDETYLDAMLSVYYKSQLQAFNSRKVEDLRFSSDLNGQSWTEAITMGAYDAVQYDLGSSDMTFSTAGLDYGDHQVTLNVAGQWTGVNRNTGATESGTDYMTIQAIWRDGMWQVDRWAPCSQEDYESGTLKLFGH